MCVSHIVCISEVVIVIIDIINIMDIIIYTTFIDMMIELVL